MHIAIWIVLILAAWRWADWKHWKSYYPSVLFLIIGDLIYNILTYNHSLWVFRPASFDKIILSNHTLITLGIDFIGFPANVLLYLSRYPKSVVKQVFYVLGWTAINSMLELGSFYMFHGISYEHGWNFGWSVIANLLLFILIRIHHVRPIAAWALFFAVASIFIAIFDIPVQRLK